MKPNTDENEETPTEVMDEWIKHCHCCDECNQDIPCGGVMAGGLCDNLCNCDEIFDRGGFFEFDRC